MDFLEQKVVKNRYDNLDLY